MAMHSLLHLPLLVSVASAMQFHMPPSQAMLQNPSLSRNSTRPILVVDHVPKCGGTFVNFMANKSVDPLSLQLVHESDQLKQEDLGQGKMVVGMIRNPFDYYISMWAYQGWFRRVTAEQLESFRPLGDPAGTGPLDADQFSRFLHFFSDKDLGLLSFLIYYSFLDFDGLIKATHYQYKGTIEDAFGDLTNGAAKKQQVISILKNFTLPSSPVDCWVHTESASNDTRACFTSFQGIGGMVNFTAFEESLQQQVFNNISHVGCSKLYTPELLDFVRSSDAELFRAFGYSLNCTS
mmetsp:Transcript_17601/g.31800  ORF Transcript_17601/g.31800 Transcript_17601/m.31800 type:complete len:292 (+) Transcript_17601:79-954(+)